MALTNTQVSELYVALFNRASEGAGNKYWQTNQPDMVSTAKAMMATPDAVSYFGATLNDNQAFIEHIYKNTLNKTIAQDPDGIKYWTDKLVAGETKEKVVVELVTAIESYKDSTDAVTKAAYDQFMNRVTVSDYTAEHFEGKDLATDMPDYATKLGFAGDLTVTNDGTTVTSAESKVDDVVQSTNAKVLTVQPDNFHGGTTDDLFDGSVIQNTINGNNVNTFTSEDRIDGGTGNDTLIIQQIGDNTTAPTVSGAVSNVENIKFTAFGNVIYDMSNTTGVKDFLNQNSVANLTVTNANEMNIGIKNVNNKATNITFDGSVYATTTDSTTLTLENVTNQAVVSLNSASNDIETLNIVSKTVANKIDLGGTAINGTTKLVITGDKDLSIDDTDNANAMTSLKTVDASAFTGALDLDLRNGGVNKLNVTTGTGDDKVMINNFDKDDIIDLGAGKDGLGIELTTSVTTAASLKNIEDIALRTSTDGLIINLDGATELERIAVELGGQTIRVTKAASSVKDIDFLSLNSKGNTTVDDINFALKDSSGTDDSLTLNFASVDSNGRAVQMNDKAVLTMTDFIANGIENITIDTANLGKDDATTTAIEGGLDISTTFTTDSLTNLTIKSDTYVNIGGALDDNVKTIDASATTAGVILDLTSVQDAGQTTTADQVLTITTGSGNDELDNVFAGAAAVQNSTFKLGEGNDTLKITGSADNATTANTGTKVTIDAGAGNDDIQIQGSVTLSTEVKFNVTLGDGIDTLTMIGDASQTGITISDFAAGSAGDKINFSSTQTATGYNETANGTNISVATTDGIVIYTANDLVTLDGSGVATAAGTASTSTTTSQTITHTANDTYLLIAGDGSDAGLFLVQDGGNTTIESGEVTLLATLTGVANTADLTVDNFTDFLA